VKSLFTSLLSRHGNRIALYAAVVALLLSAGVVVIARQRARHAAEWVPVPSRQASGPMTAGPSAPPATSPATEERTSAGGAAPPKPGGGTKVIAWLKELAPMGGRGGGDEDHVLAFRSFTRADCADVLKLASGLDSAFRPLYISGGLACRAAFGGSPQSWPAAEASLAEAERNRTRFQCFDHDLYETLRTVFDVHRQYPETRLMRQPDGDWSRSTCPRIESITPNHGRQGDQTHLTGAYLSPNTVVIFNADANFAERIDAVAFSGRDIYITVPPQAKTPDGELVESATVTVEGWPFPEALAIFHYDPPVAARSASPTPTRSGN